MPTVTVKDSGPTVYCDYACACTDSIKGLYTIILYIRSVSGAWYGYDLYATINGITSANAKSKLNGTNQVYIGTWENVPVGCAVTWSWGGTGAWNNFTPDYEAFWNNINTRWPSNYPTTLSEFALKFDLKLNDQVYKTGITDQPDNFSRPDGVKVDVYNILPVKNGYHYSGSSIDSSPVEPLTWYFTDSQQTIDIYSEWNKYKLHFKANGGNIGTMDDQDFTYNTGQAISKNHFIRGEEDNNMIYDYYLFNGWLLENSNPAVYYSDEQMVNNLTAINNQTLNIMAQWRLNVPYPAEWISHTSDMYSAHPNLTGAFKGRCAKDVDYFYALEIQECDEDWNPISEIDPVIIELGTNETFVINDNAPALLKRNKKYAITIITENAAGTSRSATYNYYAEIKIQEIYIKQNNEWKKGMLFVYAHCKKDENQKAIPKTGRWVPALGIYRWIRNITQKDGTDYTGWGGQNSSRTEEGTKPYQSGGPSTMKTIISIESIIPSTLTSVHGTVDEAYDTMFNAIKLQYTYEDNTKSNLISLKTSDILSRGIWEDGTGKYYQLIIKNINDPCRIPYTSHNYSYSVVSKIDGSNTIDCYYSDLKVNGFKNAIKPKIKVSQKCSVCSSEIELEADAYRLITPAMTQIVVGKQFTATIVPADSFKTLGYIKVNVLEDPEVDLTDVNIHDLTADNAVITYNEGFGTYMCNATLEKDTDTIENLSLILNGADAFDVPCSDWSRISVRAYIDNYDEDTMFNWTKLYNGKTVTQTMKYDTENEGYTYPIYTIDGTTYENGIPLTLLLDRNGTESAKWYNNETGRLNLGSFNFTDSTIADDVSYCAMVGSYLNKYVRFELLYKDFDEDEKATYIPMYVENIRFKIYTQVN